MARRATTTTKKRASAPASKLRVIGVRLEPAEVERLDRWIARQTDKPSRPQAIRRLISEAFKR